MKSLKVILFSMVLASCASDYKVKSIDTHLDVKGQVGNRTLGLNDQQELILQEENDAADELTVAEGINYTRSQDLQHEIFMLKECRTDMSDARLGGSGEIPPLAEVDEMKSPEQVREEIGINDDGEIKVVKKSYFVDKLKLERKYERSLKTMTKVVTRYREECEYKMGIARRNAGLPSTRYQRHGYYKNGMFIMDNTNENSLDDAFEIQAKEKALAEGK